MDKNQIKDVYELTPIEEGILFHSILSKGSGNYVIQMMIGLEGKIKKELIEQSISKLFERNEILKSIYVYEKVKKPLKVVPKDRNMEIGYYDLTDIEEDVQQLKIEEFRLNDEKRGFDLAKDILLRFNIFNLSENKAIGILTMHHVLIDGWSAANLLDELETIYYSLLNNKPLALDDVHPYRNYMKWMERNDLNKASAYWKNYLAGYETLVQVPPSFDIKNSEFKNSVKWFSLGNELTDKLRLMSSQMQVTLNSICQTLWAVLLSRYNNVDDIVYGVVTTTRPSEVVGITKMLGVFINTIPIRIKDFTNKTFEEVVRGVQLDFKQSEQYSYYSLADIQMSSALKQNLFDNIMVFENYPIKQDKELSGESFKINKIKTYEQTSYPFDIEFYPGEELRIKILYDANTYDDNFVNRIGNHVITLVNNIIEKPEMLIKDLNIIDDKELEQIMHGLSGETKDFPQNMSIYHYLEKYAVETPNKNVFSYNGETLSYTQLNNRVNQIARAIKKHLDKQNDEFINLSSTQNEPLIAIMINRSPVMAELILAIWKIGGAYIPIDAEYPAQRVIDILNDSEAKILVTEQVCNNYIDSQYKGLIIDINTINNAANNENSNNLDLNYNKNALAYVIYTSGSTGKPKGAMVEHIGMMNHMHSKVDCAELDGSSIMVQNASQCFDISVWQFFCTMLVGGRTVIYSNEITHDPDAFIEHIKNDKVTIVEVVPSFLNVILDKFDDYSVDVFSSVKYLFVTGEALKPNLISRWFKRFSNIPMVNAYGPTEASDDITHYIINSDKSYNTVPIGKPLHNFNIYITTPDMNLCPIGVKGEICVSGIGVGRGYLNNIEKTKDAFLEDPFVNESSRRLYKTGDLGRYLPDGNIEFFGRKDYQVKIRGFRIELGEIENHLVKHSDIKEAIVVDKEDKEGNKYLVAYYVSDKELSVEHIKNNVLGGLPYYMIPSYFVRLEQLPLNANGKVDRKALPSPDLSLREAEMFVEPKNEWQKKMADIWKEVLGVDRISIHDNFFSIGGHSLKATQVVSRAKKDLNIQIKLQDFFNYPTIDELSKLENQGANDCDKIICLPDQDNYETSYAQKRMWMHNQLDESGIIYNLSACYLVEGNIDYQILDKSIRYIVERHEILRANFVTVDEELKFIVKKNIDFRLKHVDLKNQNDWAAFINNEVNKDLKYKFDLQKDTLFTSKLYDLPDNKYILQIVTHHIIFDGWSADILIKEIFTVYNALINNSEISLPAIPIKYRDYAKWSNDLLNSEYNKEQRSFWLDLFKDGVSVLNLKTDKTRPEQKTFDSSKIQYFIEKEEYDKLTKLNQDLESTMFMTLLAAVQVLLYKYTGDTKLIIGTDIAGRNREELENVIGLFINTLALPLKIDENDTFVDIVKKVKKIVLGAYEHQAYPFDKLITDLKVKRDNSRSPLFDVMVSMDNISNKIIYDGNVKVSENPVDIVRSYFDLLFSFKEEQDRLFGGISYNTDLFNKSTIELMQLRFSSLLKNIIECPNKNVKDIEYITEVEKDMTSKIEVEFDF